MLEDFAIASDSRGFHRGYRGWSVASSPAFGSRGIFRRLIACRIFLADAKRTIGIGSLEIRRCSNILQDSSDLTATPVG